MEVTNDNDGDNSYASSEDPHPQDLLNEFNNEGPNGLCNVTYDDLDTDSETEPVEKDYLMTDQNDGVVERNDLEDFVTHERTNFRYNSDDSYKVDHDDGPLGDFDISTDAGDILFEIEEDDDLIQTRGMTISGHVVMNFVGFLLTRKRHQLNSSSIHK